MLSVDFTVFVVFALVWLLALVLSRVFFRPVGRILEKRRSLKEADENATREALENYERDIRRIEDGLREARSAAESTREKAEAEALREKNRLIQDVQAESRAQVEKAKKELEDKIVQLKKELDAKTEELAAEIEKRLMN